jgi:L,D-transpeptidase catalytic domain
MPAKLSGRHQNAAARRGRRRALTWVTALAVTGLGVIAATSWLLASADRTPSVARIALARTVVPTTTAWEGTTVPAHAVPPPTWPVPGSSRLAPSPMLARWSPERGGSDLMLSAQARQSCPPAALACADLRDHLTWLQSRGKITYGPVRMEPGGPSDPTPRGVFHVAWKAGRHYVSTSFGIPIPYAVFFAPGGIAFHAGSLTTSSHGCVHLSLPSARYYHDHLPVGAEVAVF